jgi:hypothetical protein
VAVSIPKEKVGMEGLMLHSISGAALYVPSQQKAFGMMLISESVLKKIQRHRGKKAVCIP